MKFEIGTVNVYMGALAPPRRGKRELVEGIKRANRVMRELSELPAEPSVVLPDELDGDVQGGALGR